ncbi:MAG: MFS transporter [Paludibacteraceae bacterium]|nr:MFS transporter [Paludibacteraceae bacterium]
MEKKRNPWSWVPTLYFAEGIPYVVAATAFAVTMYHKLGISNAETAFFTSWIYFPWVIKPFWSPFVDVMKTKRWWILFTQLLIGIGLAAVAFVIPTSFFLQSSIAILWLVAFCSATHDISADGFYMLALDEGEQSLFVGIRSTFYRISMVVGQGFLIYLAGFLEEETQDIPFAWSITLLVTAALFFIFFLYHTVILPKPEGDKAVTTSNASNFFASFKSFFKKKEILLGIAFILLYRLGEAQLCKITVPFLQDPFDKGGLGLSTKDFGLIYGTIGVLALTIGGILGGIYISEKGLKKSIFPMMLWMNLPNLIYVLMACFQPTDMWLITAGVAIEQFGYGFGFTAFMLYLIYVSQGEFKTSHYAICTGLMALGMMLPGMGAGWIQKIFGYQNFFIWACICTLPSFFLLHYLKIEDKFGKKE